MAGRPATTFSTPYITSTFTLTVAWTPAFLVTLHTALRFYSLASHLQFSAGRIPPPHTGLPTSPTTPGLDGVHALMGPACIDLPVPYSLGFTGRAGACHGNSACHGFPDSAAPTPPSPTTTYLAPLHPTGRNLAATWERWRQARRLTAGGGWKGAVPPSLAERRGTSNSGQGRFYL